MVFDSESRIVFRAFPIEDVNETFFKIDLVRMGHQIRGFPTPKSTIIHDIVKTN